jgi:hypothetical protein
MEESAAHPAVGNMRTPFSRAAAAGCFRHADARGMIITDSSGPFFLQSTPEPRFPLSTPTSRFTGSRIVLMLLASINKAASPFMRTDVSPPASKYVGHGPA